MIKALNKFLMFLSAAFLCASCVTETSKKPTSSKELPVYNKSTTAETPRRGATVVKMRKEGGIYVVPIKINGQELDFIFDTGASTISISSLEATMLYKNGRLLEDDFLGEGQFVDATGNVSSAAIFNLREVQIGNRRVTDVKAIVVDNAEAPVLLGQSALEKFGNFKIDYGRMVVIFE
jgi:aspartyl protease family protein